MPLIPYVIEQTGRGERTYDVYSRLLKERIIFLGSAIDSEAANVVTAQLLLLDSQSSEQPINLFINCPGGEVYAGLAIYDVMQYISAPVHTNCVGIAMSMGSVDPHRRRGRPPGGAAPQPPDDPRRLGGVPALQPARPRGAGARVHGESAA